MIFYSLKDTDSGVPKLIEYPDLINMYLETAYKGDSNRTEVEFKDDEGEEYVIVLKEMTEYLKKDKTNKVDVLRREKVQGLFNKNHISIFHGKM